MRQAFVLLTAAVLSFSGLGLASGCASSGQDENYKMLQEDRPLFDNRPDPSRPGESRAPGSPLLEHVMLTAPEPAAPQAQLQPTEAVEPQEDPRTSDEVRRALEVPGVPPSVTGLDRSTWPAVTVTPAPVKSNDTHGAADSVGRTETKKSCCDAGADKACCQKKQDACDKASGTCASKSTDQSCKVSKADCCSASKADAPCCKKEEAKACCATKAACCDAPEAAGDCCKKEVVKACCVNPPTADQQVK